MYNHSAINEALHTTESTLRYFSRRFATWRLPQEDLYHEGVCGLLEALARIDPTQDAVTQRAFLLERIRGSMADAQRRTRMEGNKRAGHPETFLDIAKRDPSPRSDARTERIFVTLRTPLTTHQRHILHLRYIEGYSFLEIAAHLGITESGAYYLMQRIHKTLQAALKDPENQSHVPHNH